VKVVGTSVSLMLMMVAFVTDVGGGWWWRWGGLSVTVVGTMALRRWCRCGGGVLLLFWFEDLGFVAG